MTAFVTGKWSLDCEFVVVEMPVICLGCRIAWGSTGARGPSFCIVIISEGKGEMKLKPILQPPSY